MLRRLTQRARADPRRLGRGGSHGDRTALPKGVAVGRASHPCPIGEPLERTHEHRQLEIRLGHAMRRGVNAGTGQHVVPLRRAPPAPARRTTSAPRRRPARARAGSARAASRGQRSRSRPGRRRAATPPPACPARTARRLREPSARADGRTRAPTTSQARSCPTRRRPVSGSTALPVSTPAQSRVSTAARAQTSTTTGRISGRRRVRS